MAGYSLRIDVAGIAEVLRGPDSRALVDGLADAIAAEVEAYDDRAEADVRRFTTDRAAASVAFVHPNSMDLQVRDGVLSRAAAAQGLEVRLRGAR